MNLTQQEKDKINMTFASLPLDAQGEALKHMTPKSIACLSATSKKNGSMAREYLRKRNYYVKEAMEQGFESIVQAMWRPYPANKNDAYFFNKLNRSFRGTVIPWVDTKRYKLTREEESAFKYAAKQFFAKHPTDNKISRKDKVPGLGNRTFRSGDERIKAEFFYLYEKALKKYMRKK